MVKTNDKKVETSAPRQFNPGDVSDLQELHRFSQAFDFIAKQILGNTALIPDGKKFGEQFEALGRLLQNTKQHWISQKLAEYGYKPDEKVSIDFKSGIIISESAIEQAMAAQKKGKKTK